MRISIKDIYLIVLLIFGTFELLFIIFSINGNSNISPNEIKCTDILLWILLNGVLNLFGPIYMYCYNAYHIIFILHTILIDIIMGIIIYEYYNITNCNIWNNIILLKPTIYIIIGIIICQCLIICSKICIYVYKMIQLNNENNVTLL